MRIRDAIAASLLTTMVEGCSSDQTARTNSDRDFLLAMTPQAKRYSPEAYEEVTQVFFLYEQLTSSDARSLQDEVFEFARFMENTNTYKGEAQRWAIAASTPLLGEDYLAPEQKQTLKSTLFRVMIYDPSLEIRRTAFRVAQETGKIK